MADMLDYGEALWTAQALSRGDRSGAVAFLREKLAEPRIRDFAEQALAEAAAVIKARGRAACVVTAETHDLLAAALAPEE